MLKPRSDSFQDVHFNAVTSYLGMGKFLARGIIGKGLNPNLHDDLEDFLPRLFYTQINDGCFQTPDLQNILSAGTLDVDLMMYWALWETASYLVSTKLKTPSTQPMETLQAIDKTFSCYLDILKLCAAQSTNELSIKSMQSILQRLKYLLQFIEFLQIQINNSARGCSIAIPPPSNASMAFFFSNLKVCNEYFQKIHAKIVRGAHIVDNGPLCQRLEELNLKKLLLAGNDKTVTSKIFKSIESLRRLFLATKDSSSLLGLLRILKPFSQIRDTEKVGKLIFANSLECDGFFEQAFAYYERLDPSGLDTDLTLRKLDTLAVLNDWTKFDEVLGRSSTSKHIEIVKTQIQFRKLCGPNSKRLSLNEYLSNFPSMISKLALGHSKEPSSTSLAFQVYYNGVCSLLRQSCMELISRKGSRLCAPFEELKKYQDLFMIPNPLSISAMLDIQSVTSSEQHVKYHHRSDNLWQNGTIKGQELENWIRIFNLTKKSKTNSPAINDLRFGIIQCARLNKNTEMAKRLLFGDGDPANQSFDSMTSYHEALILLDEKNYIDAYSRFMKVIAYPTDPNNEHCLQIKARCCIHFYSNNFEELLDWKTSELYPAIVNYFPAAENLSISELGITYLREATRLAPTYPNTWYKLGGYSYRQSKNLIDDLQKGGRRYFEKEILDLKSKLNSQDQSILNAILDSLLTLVIDGLKDFSSWKHKVNEQLSKEIIAVLLKMEEQIKSTIESSVVSYFKFLEVFHGSDSVGNSESDSQTVITTTLRLLRLFAKHGAYLSSLFHDCFQTTPLRQWGHVTPQLFSRIYHPDSFVRELAKQFVLRLLGANPERLIYSVLAEGNANDPLEVREFFQEMLKVVKAQDPPLLAAMSTWIKEIKRIAVLKPERLVHGLEIILHDFQHRISKIKESNKRISGNTTLAETEKRTIAADTITSILKPVEFSFESLLQQVFDMAPETLHETEFQAKFESRVKDLRKDFLAVDSITTAEYFETELILALKALKTQSKSSTLSLKNISPLLASLPTHVISIPLSGLRNQVKISCCIDTVQVLPSKTKPKKLGLLGEDGIVYSFLIKGQEDLHLDERIQQFLKIANLFLAQDSQGSKREAATFDVIPIGNDFGMIQWVDNSASLFSIYKNAQDWGFNCYKMVSKEPVASSRPPTPQECFHSKIRLLSEKGLLPSAREKWPKETLRTIYEELKRETPKDFLYNSIWTSSTSPSVWLKKTTKFTNSVAVMSIIGYILGLGDRHLENILMDLNSGQIIHIDFNVCFDKGKTLRIPELVPFRLSPNLVNAIGPIALGGSFRIDCEYVLSVLRSHREIFLTLLESFIYDPIVDWTKNSGKEKQLLNLNMNIGLLKSRVGEVKSIIQDGLLVFPVLISTLIHAIDEYLTLDSKKKGIDAERQRFELEKADDLVSISRLKQRISNTSNRLEAELKRLGEDSAIFQDLWQNITTSFSTTIVSACTSVLAADYNLPIIRSIFVQKQRIITDLYCEMSPYVQFMANHKKDFGSSHFPTILSSFDGVQSLGKLRKSIKETLEQIYRTQPSYLAHYSLLIKASDSLRTRIDDINVNLSLDTVDSKFENIVFDVHTQEE